MDQRALIIDENIENRRELRERLSAAGWQVEDVRDGMSALDAIQHARTYGEGYNCIITELFLPDLDGILLLKTLRQQYPDLALAVLTSYGNEQVQAEVEALGNTLYFNKPQDCPRVIEALAGLNLAADTTTPAEPPTPEAFEGNIGAYIFLRVGSTERVAELYESVRHLDGVISANAVRGDFDLLVRVAVPAEDRLKEVIDLLCNKEGVNCLGYERIIEPRLGPGTEEFVKHFQTVWAEVNKDYVAGQETNAYLIIDIDRYQFERIFTSIKLTEGVYRCRAIAGSGKLMVLMSGAVRPGVVRHLLRKLAEMNGILRVREATVINLNQ